MKEVLKIFQKRLTNLTSSNKSLSHLKLIKSQDLDLHALDHVHKFSSFEILEKIINRKKVELCNYVNSRDHESNEVSKQLRRVTRTSKFITEERGSKDLYVGWPYVHGKLGDDSYVRTPLLFFPVEVTLDGNKWILTPRKDEPASFNKSFLLAYSHYNDIPLDDDFLDQSFDDFPSDTQEFRNKFYEFLKSSPLEINFNQELFENRLIQFTSYKKADFVHLHPLGELKLYPEAVVGIFPQAGSFLYPDYEDIISENTHNSLEEFFLDRNPFSKKEEKKDHNFSYQFINEIKEEQLLTPFKIDTSQENAIKAIKKGHSVVIQGPPGSGKSQLISNIISDFSSRGKNVLLVCQKRAALDVVYERLGERGVAPFTGLIHDFKNDRKALYKKINAQIERLDEYKTQNNGLDSIELEREFIQNCRKIDQVTEELEEYKWALFDDKEYGQSIKELYLNSDPKDTFLDLTQEYKTIDYFNIEDFLSTLKYYLPHHLKLSVNPHPLKNRRSFSNYQITDLQKITEVIKEVKKTLHEANESSLKILGTSFDLDEYISLNENKERFENLLKIIKSKRVFNYFQHLLDKEPDKDWLLLKEKRILDSFKNEGMEESLSKDDLGDFLQLLNEYQQSRKNILKKAIYFIARNKSWYKIRRVLVANDLGTEKKDVSRLRQKLDNRLNYEHNLTSLIEKKWIIDAPRERDFEKTQQWFHHIAVAVEAQELIKDLRSLTTFLNLDTTTYTDLHQKLTSLLRIAGHVSDKKVNWNIYLTPFQIHQLTDQETYEEELLHVLPKDFDIICEYDKMSATLSAEQKSIINKLSDSLENSKWSNIEKLLRNSVAIAWINHIETKYPVLKIASHGKIDHLETELQNAVKRKRELSKEIVGIRLRERAYRNIEYNRLNNRVTYRELQHQVTKKRKVWPIRKVIENFSRELFDIMPCWLASPETVSAIFPLENFFDLVIFDEASQCFSEKGIPSIYRGKQLVITGDDQQLSPFDLYQIRYDTETQNEDAEVEKESLLDLGKMQLMQLQLTGHYRSKSLDLIDFSNQHFYDGKLELIQDFHESKSYSPAITYINVKGTWRNNRNEIEAKEVLKIIKNKLENGITEIGIITFNYNQQQLISELLEEDAIENNYIIPDRLFVKNIENVQGDERDHIIFSLGYGPNEVGKVSNQFGSLNTEKGENRLNVAVTRAKESITLIASIIPSELNVDHLKSEGPKLLKKYLQYAQEVSAGKWKPLNTIEATALKKSLLKDHIPQEVNSYNLKKYYPFADLSVYKEEELYGVILTDDMLYHQSTSAKDKHAYLPLSLKWRKWPYVKIRSRNFWLDRSEVVTKIERAFTDA